MAFLWPGFLYALFLIPIIIAGYAWALHRRARFTVRHSWLTLVREGYPQQFWPRRHVPFGLLLLGLGSVMISMARPTAVVTAPAAEGTIMLAIDVSGSMCSTDIQPTRLQAAEAAATAFVREQKPTARIGIVAFAGFAELVQPPTTDHEALQGTIESLLTGRGTAIGSAILESIDAIAEVDKRVAPSDWNRAAYTGSPTAGKHAVGPDVVVLLTDGSNNTGPLPINAAQQAAERGVRVYTIGFGTPSGSEFASCQSSDPSGLGGSGGFGGFVGGGGASSPLRVDTDTLRRIADVTGGAYYPAPSARTLQDVFGHLPATVITEQETSEVSVVFVAVGALFIALALLLSLVWHPLP